MCLGQRWQTQVSDDNEAYNFNSVAVTDEESYWCLILASKRQLNLVGKVKKISLQFERCCHFSEIVKLRRGQSLLSNLFHLHCNSQNIMIWVNEVKLNDATGPTKDLGSGTEYSEKGVCTWYWKQQESDKLICQTYLDILFKTGTQISSKLANVLH